MKDLKTRYSDADLTEFKSVLDKKLERAKDQLDALREQFVSITESLEEEKDMLDDSSSHTDMEMLQGMIQRQRKHIQDLENALHRIRNKSYGICIITGELIDKRRLLAVPTTTKSLAAKLAMAAPVQEKVERKPVTTKKAAQKPRIITKVIRKSNAAPSTERFFDDSDDDLEQEDFDLYDDETIDPDSLEDEGADDVFDID